MIEFDKDVVVEDWCQDVKTTRVVKSPDGQYKTKYNKKRKGMVNIPTINGALDRQRKCVCCSPSHRGQVLTIQNQKEESEEACPKAIARSWGGFEDDLGKAALNSKAGRPPNATDNAWSYIQWQSNSIATTPP